MPKIWILYNIIELVWTLWTQVKVVGSFKLLVTLDYSNNNLWPRFVSFQDYFVFICHNRKHFLSFILVAMINDDNTVVYLRYTLLIHHYIIWSSRVHCHILIGDISYLVRRGMYVNVLFTFTGGVVYVWSSSLTIMIPSYDVFVILFSLLMWACFYTSISSSSYYIYI